ncbi:hypothetical protein ACFFX0_20345 [Citricoccus parietis]|uniref:Uncharacterized protein n=1 Tax=Citricoccus parietis TaxID=592307 RepID=A0ABV5G3C0_9MICC
MLGSLHRDFSPESVPLTRLHGRRGQLTEAPLGSAGSSSRFLFVSVETTAISRAFGRPNSATPMPMIAMIVT